MKRLPFWKTGQTTVKGILKKMPFLCRFSHKETCAPLILIPFSLVLKNAVSKTRTADNVYYFRVTHSVPLQCGNPSGRLPRYARNDTVLRTEWNESLFAEKNNKIYIHSPLCYLVQRTLCHCEAPLCGAVAISRKGHLVIPRKILL